MVLDIKEWDKVGSKVLPDSMWPLLSIAVDNVKLRRFFVNIQTGQGQPAYQLVQNKLKEYSGEIHEKRKKLRQAIILYKVLSDKLPKANLRKEIGWDICNLILTNTTDIQA